MNKKALEDFIKLFGYWPPMFEADDRYDDPPSSRRRKKPTESSRAAGFDGDMTMLPSLASVWDEPSITRQLVQLRDQRPSLIPHFINSIKERWIVRQDDHTAEVRLQFLKKQIEQLKLAKEFQQTIDDLQILSLEKTKRIKTLVLETEEIDSKRRERSQLEEIQSLRERKKIELEIAQLDRQIDDIKNPPKAEPEPRKPSREEQCQQKREEIDRKMDQVRRDAAERMKNPTLTDFQRKQIENGRNQALHELEQERSKWLY